MTIIRGVATSRGIAATSAAVLTFLLLVTVVPAVTFLPSAAVVATGGEHGPPTSTVGPLPEYTTSQVVTTSYAVFCSKKKTRVPWWARKGSTAAPHPILEGVPCYCARYP